MRGEQAIFNLEIKKKSGLSINPDIHHSKVPSSDLMQTDLKINRTSYHVVLIRRPKNWFLNTNFYFTIS